MGYRSWSETLLEKFEHFQPLLVSSEGSAMWVEEVLLDPITFQDLSLTWQHHPQTGFHRKPVEISWNKLGRKGPEVHLALEKLLLVEDINFRSLPYCYFQICLLKSFSFIGFILFLTIFIEPKLSDYQLISFPFRFFADSDTYSSDAMKDSTNEDCLWECFS
jgi:hypothetical protein